MEKLPQWKNAKGLAETVIRMFTPYKKWVHTITSDNRMKSAEHKMIAKKLDARFFLGKGAERIHQRAGQAVYTKGGAF